MNLLKGLCACAGYTNVLIYSFRDLDIELHVCLIHTMAQKVSSQ